MTTPPIIEDDAPIHWRQLQEAAARILRESGMAATTDATLNLARGSVNVDVFARDPASSPPSTMIVECKLWKRRVTREKVHALRTVVADSGANLGVLLAAYGAQQGAVDATGFSNVVIRDWREFQEMFASRWFVSFFVPTLAAESTALFEYTEPINSRIARKEASLPPDRLEALKALRKRHWPLAWGLGMLRVSGEEDPSQHPLPDLPLRTSYWPVDGVPGDIVDAQALRPLLETAIARYRAAIAEFDELFGGRA
jgi:restriction system protein